VKRANGKVMIRRRKGRLVARHNLQTSISRRRIHVGDTVLLRLLTKLTESIMIQPPGCARREPGQHGSLFCDRDTLVYESDIFLQYRGSGSRRIVLDRRSARNRHRIVMSSIAASDEPTVLTTDQR